VLAQVSQPACDRPADIFIREMRAVLSQQKVCLVRGSKCNVERVEARSWMNPAFAKQFRPNEVPFTSNHFCEYETPRPDTSAEVSNPNNQERP
jgi:hypothetical protein